MMTVKSSEQIEIKMTGNQYFDFLVETQNVYPLSYIRYDAHKGAAIVTFREQVPADKRIAQIVDDAINFRNPWRPEMVKKM